MAFISDVKKDMDFYKDLSELLKVLKGIAISQFYAFEKKVYSFEKFSYVVEGFLGGIDLKDISHPFINPTTDIVGVIAVTSDAGLLGGLNVQVINTAFKELSEKRGRIIVVGERGRIYVRERGINCVYMEGIKEDYIFEQAQALRNHIIKEVIKGNMGEVKIVYPHAYSLAVQRVEVESLLPYGKSGREKKHIDIYGVIWESPVERVVEYLIYLWMIKRIYEIFMTSKLSEFAARFMHLEDCTRKIEELDEKLRYKYFRLRHELTDRSMRELFAAKMIFDRKLKSK